MSIAGLGIQALPGIAHSEDKVLWQSVINILALQGVFLLTSVGTMLAFHYPRWSQFGFSQGPWYRNVLWIILSTVVAVLLCYLVDKAIISIIQHFDFPIKEQVVVEKLRQSDKGLPIMILTLSAVIIAPVCEEVFFRGFLYQLGRPKGKWKAAITISILFGLLHFPGMGSTWQESLAALARTFPLMVLSGFLFAAYETTGNLLTPIGCHILFNIFGVLGTRNFQF